MIFSVSSLLFFLGVYHVDSFGRWSTLVLSLACLLVSLSGTLREAYHFDKETDSYAFVRQFIHRKEIIEGAASQFRGVRVHEIEDRGGEYRTTTYVVNLLQDGMLFGSSPELTLRDRKPILNFHSIETRIATAIASFL